MTNYALIIYWVWWGMNHRRSSVAVVRLDLGSSSRKYAEAIDEVLSQISDSVSILLTLSLVSPLSDFLNGRREYPNYKNFMKSVNKKLLSVARRRGVSIVVTPVIRKGGDKAYLSTGVMPPLGQPVFRAGNTVPVNDRVSSNKNPEVLQVGGVKLCFAYIKELEIPEVARVCKFLGSDAIVAVNPPLLTGRDPELTLKLGVVRAVENNVPIIGLGGYLTEKKIQQPTFLISSFGEVIDFYNDYEPAVFEVEVEGLERVVRLDLMKRYLRLIEETKSIK